MIFGIKKFKVDEEKIIKPTSEYLMKICVIKYLMIILCCVLVTCTHRAILQYPLFLYFTLPPL